MTPRRVVICDLGLGNLRSVERALTLGATLADVSVAIEITRDPARIGGADRLVVPGQGAFRDGAEALQGGLGDALRGALHAGIPYLGICLGLQLLFEGSDEAPDARGLAWLEGRSTRLHGDREHKIPHMGWSRVEACARHPALERALAEASWFYFAHSFHVVPADPRVVLARAAHGSEAITAAISSDRVLGVQFHPEKSQRAGLALLAGFLA